MANWVNISTINNTTPFYRIGWKQGVGSGDRWFAEKSGLTTDNMGWTGGKSDSYGRFTYHRFNSNQYTCNFLPQYDSYDDGYGTRLGYGTAVRDESRSNLPSETINGDACYVLNLTEWSGWTALYAPYSSMTMYSNFTIYVDLEDPSVPVVTSITITNLQINGDVPASGGTVSSADCTFNVIAVYSNSSTGDVTTSSTISGSLYVPATIDTTRHQVGTLTLTAVYDTLSATSSVSVYQEGYVSTYKKAYVNGHLLSKLYCNGTVLNKLYSDEYNIYQRFTIKDYKDEYFTFDVISGGTIYLTALGNISRSVEYKINDGAWTSAAFASGANATSISVQDGDIVKFRGDNADYATARTVYTRFSGDTDVRFNIYGNLMSLIDSTGFTTNSTLTNAMTFRCFFSACTGVVNVENLIFPEVIQSNSFKELFANCKNLTTAPKSFPATALTESCYANMFQGCTGLTTVPTLPAMTIVKQSYEAMFSGCTSLTTAPELPATTLGEKSYNQMFYGCTSLNYIKCLATDISASRCTYGWVNGVAATGTFVKDANMTGWTTGVDGIPSGWTVN